VSTILICSECFEENTKCSVRCSRCGNQLTAPSLWSKPRTETSLVIGGLPINRAAMHALGNRSGPRRVTMLGVLAGVAILIIILQLSPTIKRAPNPIRNLRETLVTAHSIEVAWTSVDSYSNGLRFFAVRIAPTPGTDPLRGAHLVASDHGCMTGLSSGTRYVMSVTSVATNGLRSKSSVIYVTTKSL
jgi:hypothetical protein